LGQCKTCTALRINQYGTSLARSRHARKGSRGRYRWRPQNTI
jgi:hypothetical protein